MDETLKLILEKLSNLENENKITHQRLEKLDKLESDINSLKNENKTNNKITHQKLEMLINETANIKEKITEHDMKIQVINNSKAI